MGFPRVTATNWASVRFLSISIRSLNIDYLKPEKGGRCNFCNKESPRVGCTSVF